jgi:alanine dehydrogenase
MDHEFRVGMTPQGIRELVIGGHEVLVEAGAGLGSGFTDEDYRRAGASLRPEVGDLYREAEMIVKVKEPQPREFDLLRPGQVLFCFLHLAAHKQLAEAFLAKETIAVAYETVEVEEELPLLSPMSEVAGRLAPQIGAHYLEKMNGGRGVLMGGATGVAPADVLILGAGIVGANAAIVATGLEAHVLVLDKDIKKLKYLEHILHGRISTLMSNRMNLEEAALRADLVIGAVLVPGALAPRVLEESVVREMRPGSVFVDVAIDQGGCADTSCLTTHSDPVYTTHGVVHYCVGNIPALVPRTSTFALTNATLPYIEEIAGLGIEEACAKSPGICSGINVIGGAVVSQPVADSLELACLPLEEAIGRGASSQR